MNHEPRNLVPEMPAMPPMDTAVAEVAPPVRDLRLGLAGWSWLLFDSCRVPQLLLVSGFVFAPYFTTVVLHDPVRGQKLIAQMGTWVGVAVALVAPILGATVDKFGPRKPWIAAGVACMVQLLTSLWWAKPDGSGLGVFGILIVLAAVTALPNLTDVMFTSMMHFAVGRERAAKASGLGLTVANVVGVAALVTVLWIFELPEKMALPFLPAHPLFGLNAEACEPKRIVGPIAGALWLIFSMPLLLFTPDGAPTGRSAGQAMLEGMRSLGQLVRSARTLNRNLAIFLLARVAYYDALAGYVAMNGVYAAGVMGWHGPRMLVFGIFTAAFCMFGGLVAQALDRTLGPRRALLIELAGLSSFVIGQVGTSPTRIFYLPYQSGWPVTPDTVFFACGLGAAVCLAATGASNRTLTVRLAPSGQLGSVLGLAALGGSSTAWLLPLMIAGFTARYHSQQAGFVPLLFMLIAGTLILSLVRGGDRWRAGIDEEVLDERHSQKSSYLS